MVKIDYGMEKQVIVDTGELLYTINYKKGYRYEKTSRVLIFILNFKMKEITNILEVVIVKNKNFRVIYIILVIAIFLIGGCSNTKANLATTDEI